MESIESKYVSPEELESQEHLSLDFLKKIKSTGRFDPVLPRPAANFIDLMNWAVDGSLSVLSDKYVNKFVQNRIIIDGQFVKFCNENDIDIECIYRDSIISWKTEHEYEKFFVQGIFLIKSKDCEFIHAALFHKGNQNEDEISFFILVYY